MIIWYDVRLNFFRSLLYHLVFLENILEIMNRRKNKETWNLLLLKYMALWIFLEGWGLIQYFSKPVLIKLYHNSSKINFLYLALKLITKCKSLEWLLHCKWQNWRNTTINLILLKLGYMSCLVLHPNLASFQYVVILLSFKRNSTYHATYHSDLTQHHFFPFPLVL